MVGLLKKKFPDVHAMLFADSVATQEQVASVVQKTLKKILGGQFSELEGLQLIARAYNDMMEEDDNAMRVASLLTYMKIAHKQKSAAVAHFQKWKTLDGFKGIAHTSGSFESAIAGELEKPGKIWTDPSGSGVTVQPIN